MSRKIIVLLVTVTILLSATPARAGGWVVITLDSLPEEIHVGEPLSIGFVVRRHGQTPTHDLSPVVIMTNMESGRKIRIEAEKAADTGHFTATINFPSEGEWEWLISAEPFNQSLILAPVTVGGPLEALEAETNLQGSYQLQVVLRWGSLLLFGAALGLALLDRRRDAATKTQMAGD